MSVRQALRAPSQRLVARLERLASKRYPMRQGNLVELLVNGQQYFPALFKAIESAQSTIHLETYIFAQDALAIQVRHALCEAATRGVSVRLVVDGFGAANTVHNHLPDLTQAGVQVRVFRPYRWFSLDGKRLRRMHRKLVLIDQKIAFVGGINIIDDFTQGDDLAPNEAADPIQPRYDFVVRLEGAVVADCAVAAEWLWWQIGPGGKVTDTFASDWWRQRAQKFQTVLRQVSKPHALPKVGQAAAQLVLRDNFRFRRAIEKTYLKAIGEARQEIILANAYFLPGQRVRRALRIASQRGVRVQLLLQGRVEYRLQHYATLALYESLLKVGIEIYEYQPSYLHAKVAVVDRRWATVGSSNIDPLSFLLAREMNVQFSRSVAVDDLHRELSEAIGQRSRRIYCYEYSKRPWLKRALSWVCYGLLRMAVAVSGPRGRY